MNPLDKNVVTMTQLGDATSIGITLGALVGFLPHIASVLSIIWLLLRIWETDTVQKLFKRKKEKNDGAE